MPIAVRAALDFATFGILQSPRRRIGIPEKIDSTDRLITFDRKLKILIGLTGRGQLSVAQHGAAPRALT